MKYFYKKSNWVAYLIQTFYIIILIFYYVKSINRKKEGYKSWGKTKDVKHEFDELKLQTQKQHVWWKGKYVSCEKEKKKQNKVYLPHNNSVISTTTSRRVRLYICRQNRSKQTQR